jgi:hypothetical protein
MIPGSRAAPALRNDTVFEPTMNRYPPLSAGREGRSSSARATKADFLTRRWNDRHSSDVCGGWCILKIELIDHCLNLRDLRGTRMSDVAEKLARWRLLRNMAMIAVVVPATLSAGCARQEAAPPPPPAVSEAPPPAPAPPLPPPPAPTRAPAIGERG